MRLGCARGMLRPRGQGRRSAYREQQKAPCHGASGACGHGHGGAHDRGRGPGRGGGGGACGARRGPVPTQRCLHHAHAAGAHAHAPSPPDQPPPRAPSPRPPSSPRCGAASARAHARSLAVARAPHAGSPLLLAVNIHRPLRQISLITRHRVARGSRCSSSGVVIAARPAVSMHAAAAAHCQGGTAYRRVARRSGAPPTGLTRSEADRLTTGISSSVGSRSVPAAPPPDR